MLGNIYYHVIYIIKVDINQINHFGKDKTLNYNIDQWFSNCGTRTTNGTRAPSSGTRRDLIFTLKIYQNYNIRKIQHLLIF